MGVLGATPSITSENTLLEQEMNVAIIIDLFNLEAKDEQAEANIEYQCADRNILLSFLQRFSFLLWLNFT